MKYRLCLFDFDYTLADATMPITECFKYTFSMMNLDCYYREKVIKTIGMTLDNAFKTLTEIEDEVKIKEFVDIYKSKSDEITVKNTVLFDDTIDTLKKLKENDIKIGIVSSRMGERIIKILNHLDCYQYIDYVIGYENVSTHKPDPEGLNMAIEYFNCDKEEVLYVGDSYIDAGAAENANIDFIAVTTGTTSKDEFEKYNHIKIVEKLSKILDVI
ncbi:HAD-IA family hydrolase [Terrisporobacter mayombei]|nr:HAD-IA family hydrolase [Terrisporobacter mayombei]